MSLQIPRPAAFHKLSSVASSGGESDEAVAGRVYERVASRLGPRIRRLDVSVHQGHILLSGECSTYHTKQLAQHAALGVIEHESLENEIVVTRFL